MNVAMRKASLLSKLFIRIWDPDFTKVTPAERRELDEIERDMLENGTIPADQIDWDN